MKTAKCEGNAALHLGNEVGARVVHVCSMCVCVCVCTRMHSGGEAMPFFLFSVRKVSLLYPLFLY